ncbi:DUF58 domain-containing protein [Cellulomonas marina]|uniref:Uncharacterized conserved protein, DUF58 family, contains vWF domain n=1 Tax=Cellulomonas marina TaxID=988821 RepID=A0A1I0W6R6_9CELL|nr:DUF58 domain-containing protein [Cellulomonas marina]GIG29995.1 hypothetical protein Cma02nite_25950 [Cellulomonas marina]SFA83616.1 Uncharacterized conserved protein, DUF58 family, contains vWF domain [Cellulomonas marina]
MSTATGARGGSPGAWGSTTWARTSSALGVGAALVAVLAGRPDLAVLAVLAVPPLAHGAWGLLVRRPSLPPGAQVTAGHEGTAGAEVPARLALAVPAGTDAVHVRLRGPGERHLLLDAARTEVPVRARTARTGLHPLLAADALALGTEGAVASGPVAGQPLPVLVLPAVALLPAAPLPWRLRGATGPHDDRRPGHGTDPLDVARWQPGERLRRVDWRTTVRRSAATGGVVHELHVRRSLATAEASVVLVLDSRDEVGPDPATWSGVLPVPDDVRTSLDVARAAGAALARRYLEQGDRVALEDLGRHGRPVPAGGGRRHLQRLVRRLAAAAPQDRPAPRRRAPHVPAGALVVVLSTFLDDEAARLAHGWRRAGHRVVAVDVLPVPRARSTAVRTALRLVLLEREDRLAALVRTGVELVAWSVDGPAADAAGARAARLAALTRLRPRPGATGRPGAGVSPATAPGGSGMKW